MPTPLVAPPYGRDMSCVDRIRPGTLVSGGVLLGEAAFRRLNTERGTLEYDLNYGYSLAQRLNDDLTEDDIAAMPDEIIGELKKDPRMDRVEVTQTVLGTAPSVRLHHEIRGFGVDGEGFRLAIASSNVTVDLFELEAA